MRILHVVPSYLPATRYGGPIYSVHGLCAALAGLGHDVHVVTTSVDGAHDSPVPHGVPVARDGVTIWYFRSSFGRRLYYSPPMKGALEQLVPSADVVHLHSVFLWPTSSAARAAVRSAVPYVVSPRGMLVRDLIDRKTAWLTWLESTTLARATAIHLTSRRELIDARQLALPLPAPFVVPNGVDRRPSDDTPASSRVDRVRQSGPYCLYLGRLHPKKGLEHALAAMTDNDIRLVLCGPDDENYKPTLERAARELKVHDRLVFEDPVSGDDKWALLAHAAFVILPSLNENFGNVVVEAMTAGTAVLVSDRVGAADLVTAADAGLVCPGGPEPLRAAMLRLWNDPATCARFGANGAAYAGRELTWERVARLMSDHYAALIARSTAAGSTTRG
jgi:glycosyltransferase involved in cell wall biosynthesis